jgi:hypothetical protein
MSDPNTPPGELQFDRVEGQSGKTPGACAECGQPLHDVYYEVSGRVLCERCRRAAEATWAVGSSAGRFGKAVVFGIAAAAAGSALYYGVLALTGYEFGLIAIVVGFLVGAAVKKGSHGRGGWKYQTLAMFLTYTSIVSSYVPLIIREALKPEQQSAFQAGDTATIPLMSSDTAAAVIAVDSASHSLVASDLGTESEVASVPSNPVLAILLAIGLIYALPFLAGFQNILGLVIIAIGLYEAWKLNQRVELKVAGPFKVTA